MDAPPPDWRRRLMARIGGRDTKPELLVRKIVYGLGYRYRLYVRSLPGCPDLVFSGRRKVIFVHGCFWHQHDCPRGALPKTRRSFWEDKLGKNRARDDRNRAELSGLGWSVMTIWECEMKNIESLAVRIERFLGG